MRCTRDRQAGPGKRTWMSDERSKGCGAPTMPAGTQAQRLYIIRLQRKTAAEDNMMSVDAK